MDITSEKEAPHGLPQGGQGRSSRGGHVWPPDLDGPVTFTDTMDEAGPLGPAWKRLCPCPGGRVDKGESSDGGRLQRGEVVRTPVQVCDSMYEPLSSEARLSLRAFCGWADLVLS